MWRQALTTQDAADFMAIRTVSDPDAYMDMSKIKGAIARHSQTWAIRFAGPDEEAWIYEDGAAHAALHIIRAAAGIGHIRAFAAYGFDADLMKNWRAAYKILMDKARQVFDGSGVKEFSGRIPRTRVGECIAYFGDATMWEKTSKSIEKLHSYKFEFNRKDVKPVDEAVYPEYFVSDITPDALKPGEVVLPKPV